MGRLKVNTVGGQTAAGFRLVKAKTSRNRPVKTDRWTLRMLEEIRVEIETGKTDSRKLRQQQENRWVELSER